MNALNMSEYYNMSYRDRSNTSLVTSNSSSSLHGSVSSSVSLVSVSSSIATPILPIGIAGGILGLEKRLPMAPAVAVLRDRLPSTLSEVNTTPELQGEEKRNGYKRSGYKSRAYRSMQQRTLLKSGNYPIFEYLPSSPSDGGSKLISFVSNHKRGTLQTHTPNSTSVYLC